MRIQKNVHHLYVKRRETPKETYTPRPQGGSCTSSSTTLDCAFTPIHVQGKCNKENTSQHVRSSISLSRSLIYGTVYVSKMYMIDC